MPAVPDPAALSLRQSGPLAELAPGNGTTDSHDLTQIVGWINSSKDRGTIDILWSSCLTIMLCVWVATYPNVPSPHDKWYHRFVDKINLACIGFLGPDLLLGIAVGQLMSARRSVKMFRGSRELPDGQSWTLKHGFFADMGGFYLRAPDYPEGFPINAEQLFYLIKHGFLDFPVSTNEEIRRRSKTDDLSRIITVWQALWFTVTELQRLANGYPMTTLELTAISFAVVMIATSAVWYFKPSSIDQATVLNTKDGASIQSVREFARSQTHTDLPHHYYRTPLDFISRRKFHLDNHWQYYSELTYMCRLPLFNRPMRKTPWDRFPSDIWLPVDGWAVAFGLLIQVPFSLCFLAAWNFHFPTPAEQALWRFCAVYHTAALLFGTGYYMFGSFKGACERIVFLPIFGAPQSKGVVESGTVSSTARGETELPPASAVDKDSHIIHRGTGDSEAPDIAGAPTPPPQRKTGLPKSMARFESWLVKWRNISRDQDPDLEVPLRWVGPPLVFVFIFILAKLYIYIEDFIGLRSQPFGVYYTVNKFVPFL